MRISIPGPQAGYDWDGHIVSFAPGSVVEVDDGNEKAVAWAKSWLGMGATLVEDDAKPAASTPSVVPAPSVPEPTPVAEPVEPAEPAGPSLAELRAEAERLDLPTYGSKAQLTERIAAKNAELDQQSNR